MPVVIATPGETLYFRVRRLNPGSAALDVDMSHSDAAKLGLMPSRATIPADAMDVEVAVGPLPEFESGQLVWEFHAYADGDEANTMDDVTFIRPGDHATVFDFG